MIFWIAVADLQSLLSERRRGQLSYTIYKLYDKIDARLRQVSGCTGYFCCFHFVNFIIFTFRIWSLSRSFQKQTVPMNNILTPYWNISKPSQQAPAAQLNQVRMLPAQPQGHPWPRHYTIFCLPQTPSTNRNIIMKALLTTSCLPICLPRNPVFSPPCQLMIQNPLALEAFFLILPSLFSSLLLLYLYSSNVLILRSTSPDRLSRTETQVCKNI